MASTIASQSALYLLQQHQAEGDKPPSSLQRSGYQKIGRQFAKFVLQSRSFKHSQRARQILCANIPKICSDYGIDCQWVYGELATLCRVLDMTLVVREIEPFYQSVMDDHQTNPTPVKANMSGCLIPLALIVAVPASLIGMRVILW
ncbi:MAG: hypothetical protein FJ167_06865 [Gammaproteobacteria bacterium]|nr:hypothetical protein [Betaproteobacteria bacterium]MBM4210035.1 hypothetical protein [Gammaproteobacteria bacterium]MBM4224502.1 hypothetical protein [Gammaproteobacteria bacterium]